MKNNPHTLGRTKVKPFPGSFLFLDTETKFSQVGHKTKLHELKVGICGKYERSNDSTLSLKNEIIIWDKQTFINWMDENIVPRTTNYLIAHNIVYDATILDLFRLLPAIGFTMQSLYSKGQVCLIRWKKERTTLVMMDNGNIFSGTLEKWGGIFNVPKIKIDFETCTKQELIIYCHRDVEIMVKAWEAWMKFNDENNCGGFRETVGSTAFNAWRHSYDGREIYVHKQSETLLLEREAYHGGRVEAFHQGRLESGPYYYADINNMYGYVMLRGQFPQSLQGHSTRMKMKRMVELLGRYSIIARVTVNVDEPAFIHKINGFACYPLGRFETVLTTNEIIYALEMGWLESVKEFSWYRKGDIFSEYVDRFFNLRKHYRDEGNTGFEQICKLMINSLYGKFGQTGIDQRKIGVSTPDEIWHMPVINAQTHEKSYQTSIGGIVYEEFKLGESYHAVPSIAAHVTADARLYLFQLIKQAGWGNVFYCDTDSLIVNQAGYYNLDNRLDENKLGMLKIETKSPWLVINAPKDYQMEDRRKIKGIRGNAIELSSGVFAQEQWIKLAGLIRDGFNSGYITRDIIKHQSRVIHSGEVLEGGRIIPFQV